LLEPAFGHSFANVRVHADGAAAESARALAVHAYAVGNHIVLGRGKYSPDTANGVRLLAHELAHVVQARAGGLEEPALSVQLDRHGHAESEARTAEVEFPVRSQVTVGSVAPTTIQARDISLELDEATKLPLPSPTLPGLTKAEEEVLAWLQKHRAEVEAGEAHWHIDRRAIAGAIAWEALNNVRSIHMGRWALAPGKPHYTTEMIFGEGDPVAKQVETLGLEPTRTMKARRTFLEASIANAIDYIGAIMDAFADIAAQHGYSIRCDPLLLTNCYQGGGVQKDFKTWETHLKTKKGTPLVSGNRMAVWTGMHMSYLQAGVGAPDASVCTKPPPAVPKVDISKLTAHSH
jgi:hypothetical protein